MIYSEKAWIRYIDYLRAVNETAAKKYADYLNTHDISTEAGKKQAIDYAVALAQRYGESAAAISCEMYDNIAEKSGVDVQAAEPADLPTYGEVAKTVNGMVKQNQGSEAIGSAVGRLVKRTGVDTTIKNAIRDGAEWAWIPHGDTCSFCLMLASNGWQKASKKALKGGHAEHIHANCDCTYAVRFDHDSGYAGYDPDKYRKIYEDAEGDTWEEKLNSMRRAEYAENREKIRAQKREAYERVKRRQTLPSDVTEEFLRKAKPGKGTITIDEGYNREEYKAEIEISEWIHKELGGEITVRIESKVEGEESADYEWNGRLWELKTLSSSTYNKTDKRIQKANSQIDKNRGGIILDYSHSALSITEAEKLVRESAQHRISKPTDIIIKKGDAFIVLRFT